MPDSLRATALSTHAIRLTWSVRLPAPESAEIEVIDGFYIGYRAVAGSGLLDSSTSTTTSSYTYKTIANSPLQALYGGKMVLMNNLGSSSPSTSSSWPPSSKSYFRSSPGAPSASFLIRLQNQSSLIEGDSSSLHHHVSSPLLPSPEYLKMSSGEGPSSSSSLNHQYYEHIVESLVRQTQYQ